METHREKQGPVAQPTQRFSDRVDYYIKYRPGYPAEIITFLTEVCGLTQASLIADVGSGTGLLSRLFLENGNRVIGIEPNVEMRSAGETYLRNYPSFTSLAATAEATTLPDQSIDVVTAGQAFHWFRQQEAVVEFRRILKPGGWVALIWNDRQIDTTPFLQAYEHLLQNYATDYRAVDHKNVTHDHFDGLFGQSLKLKTFSNNQRLGYEELEGRLLSSSYAPLAGQPNYEPMLAELRRIFAAQQRDGTVDLQYTTLLYYCQF